MLPADCLVHSTWRPLQAMRDSVREEPVREEPVREESWACFHHSSEVGAAEGVKEPGQDVLGVKVVPKADKDGWEPSPAEALGGRDLRSQEVSPACQASCLPLSLGC